MGNKYRFDEDGVSLLEKGLDSWSVDLARTTFDSYFPSYYDGDLDFHDSWGLSELQFKAASRSNPIFSPVVSVKGGSYRFDGIPHEYRALRGQGPVDLENFKNCLFGKRISMSLARVSEKDLTSLVTPEVLDLARHLLETHDISLAEGSINRIFPGYRAEEGKLHIDTYGFTYGNQSKRKDFFVNIMIFPRGTTDGRSPTRLIAGSHKHYETLNTIVSRAVDNSDHINLIHQNELCEELLPEELLQAVEYMVLPEGGVLAFRSDTVHSSTPNINDHMYRDAVILSFAKASSNFGKTREREEHIGFNRVNHTLGLVDSGRGRPGNSALRDSAQMIHSQLKLQKASWVKTGKLLTTGLRRAIRPKPEKLLLNLGCGPSFIDHRVVGVDYNGTPEKIGIRDKRSSTVNFFIDGKNQLPFEDGSVEGIYCSHTLEHLQPHVVEFTMMDAWRILRKGGVFRVILPDMELYGDAYQNCDLAFFNWVRNKSVYRFDSWVRLIGREVCGNVIDHLSQEFIYTLLNGPNGIREFVYELNLLSDEYQGPENALPDVHKSGHFADLTIKSLKDIGFSSARQTERFESAEPIFSVEHDRRYNHTRANMSMYIEAIK